MLVPNQIIKMKWTGSCIPYYKSKGYPYTKYGEEFEVKAEDLSPSSRKKVKVICDFCNKEYNLDYKDYLDKTDSEGKNCCSKCRGKRISQRYKEKIPFYIQKARQKCEELGLVLLSTENDYIDSDTPLKILCPKHGIINITSSHIYANKHICSQCAWDSLAEKRKYTTEQVIEIIESKNDNKLLNPEEYINAKEYNLKVLCGICKQTIFDTCLDVYMRPSSRCMCKSCANIESGPERRIRVFLENNNINFIQEYTFKDCKDVSVLPFDFYLNDYNKIIEFDGEQHYRPAGFGGKSYESIIKHDKIKNEYCKSHGIDLLRIPYWNENNIEEILKKELNIA